MMANPLREDNKMGKRGVRKGLAILAGREIHKRKERNHKKGVNSTLQILCLLGKHMYRIKEYPLGWKHPILGRRVDF